LAQAFDTGLLLFPIPLPLQKLILTNQFGDREVLLSFAKTATATPTAAAATAATSPGDRTAITLIKH